MNLFGLSFLLFILKWSAGKGFWYQLQVPDKPTFKKAITVEHTCKKVEKCKLDISFLVKCQDGNLQPTFTRVKRFKGMAKKTGNIL